MDMHGQQVFQQTTSQRVETASERADQQLAEQLTDILLVRMRFYILHLPSTVSTRPPSLNLQSNHFGPCFVLLSNSLREIHKGQMEFDLEKSLTSLLGYQVNFIQRSPEAPYAFGRGFQVGVALTCCSIKAKPQRTFADHRA